MYKINVSDSYVYTNSQCTLRVLKAKIFILIYCYFEILKIKVLNLLICKTNIYDLFCFFKKIEQYIVVVKTKLNTEIYNMENDSPL